jgi:transposase
MNAHLTKFMTYFKIHQMERDGHSTSQISKHLSLNRRTVTKYLAMSEQEYEDFLSKQSERKKELLPYEAFVKDRLRLFQDTPCAQMHDWLKEYHPDFPKVNPKTVFNFVTWVRNKYNLPKINLHRQHHPVDEMPYGQQAQIDFGEYSLRTSIGTRIKVFFFVLVLSRSRFKYVWFSENHFTSHIAIEAHERAFRYIHGIPSVCVYDQDKVFIVNENRGDLILTDEFRAYTREKAFTLHFCRKADPQSKGKVENAVKYVKQNFLYNRIFYNIDTLNDEAMGWLGRTANALPHAFTQKVPRSEWNIEQPFLKPYTATILKSAPVTYTVRKDNTVSYKSNLYSLPLGTYTGRGCVVSLRVEQGELILSKNEVELCRHEIDYGKGQKIINTDHKRDKSFAINEMIQQLSLMLENPEQAKAWMASIRTDKPRYIRDQLLIIKKVLEQATPTLINKALDYCVNNKITSAMDFRAIVNSYEQELPSQATTEIKIISTNPLGGPLPKGAMAQPEKSRIEDYQTIFENNYQS